MYYKCTQCGKQIAAVPGRIRRHYEGCTGIKTIKVKGAR